MSDDHDTPREPPRYAPDPEIHDEISTVTEVQGRVVDRVDDLGPAARKIAAAIVAEIVPTIRRAERRAADRDVAVLQSRGGGEDLTERLQIVEDKHLRLTGMEERNGRIGRLEGDLSRVVLAEEKRAGKIAAVISAIGVALGGSVFAVVSSIRDGGRDEQRLQRLERDVRELADDIEMIRAPWRTDRVTLPVYPAPTGD